MKMYSKQDVDGIHREHVPPKKLGGDVKTITCKQCNNTAGYKFESELNKKMKEVDTFTGGTGRTLDIKYAINQNDEKYLNAKFNILFDEDGKSSIKIIGVPERSDPVAIKNLSKRILEEGIENFSLKIPTYHKDNANIALLRIAYLWAFSQFGYLYILQPSLTNIRKQILEPNNKIIPGFGVTNYNEFPDEFLGINIIRLSNKLRGFLVVFDLALDSFTYRFGVILPGLDSNSLDIYSELNQQNQTMQTENIFKEYSFEKSAFIVSDVWNQLLAKHD